MKLTHHQTHCILLSALICLILLQLIHLLHPIYIAYRQYSLLAANLAANPHQVSQHLTTLTTTHPPSPEQQIARLIGTVKQHRLRLLQFHLAKKNTLTIIIQGNLTPILELINTITSAPTQTLIRSITLSTQPHSPGLILSSTLLLR